ncbi:MAG: hypothetical protein Kow0080_22220 [Candidatus Promineifilaceae bacterium]
MVEPLMTLNNRYELLEKLGSGGMATVYKARDRALGRLVAVKMLHESLTSDVAFLERFQREAHAAANLAHPNIVTVHDIGQDDHRHYIVMEYVNGRTLKQIIRDTYSSGQVIPINRALDLTIQICQGIGYAHRAKLVHCDVKPQNVLVTHDDRVKVADFGIARAFTGNTIIEEVSQVWGTPQYFSPEQASGLPATPASDVYAIGLILFELLTGQLPFKAENHTAMALKHIHEPPPPISTLNPAVPMELERIIAKVLSKEPSGRYRTAGQLGRILSTYRQSSRDETVSMPVPPVKPGREPRPIKQNTPVHELPTQIYAHGVASEDKEDTKQTPKRERPSPPPTLPKVDTDSSSVRIPLETAAPAEGNDWIAITLGIAAIIALLGLIPLWFAVFLAYTG